MVLEQQPGSSDERLRASRRYLAWIAAVFILLSMALLGLVVVSAGPPPREHSSSSSQYIHFWKQRKLEILDYYQGPRLVVVGGSASLYGLRSGPIARSLGMPVVNLGLHAGLGLPYLLYNATRHLRSGDIVLLVPEYEMLVTDDPAQWTLADYALQHDLRFVRRQTLRRIGELLRKRTLEEYAYRLLDRFADGPDIDAQPFRDQLNGYGDLLSNVAGKAPDEARHRIASYDKTTLWDKPANREVLLSLAGFADWCRRHGIEVIGGFQPFFGFSNLSGDKAFALINDIEHFYVSNGIPAVGQPRDYLFARDRLFDSYNHLDDTGAQMMSELMIPAIGRLVGGRAAPATPAHAGAVRELRFKEADLPLFVERVRGFSVVEPWGRWTLGATASVELKEPLPDRVRVTLEVRDMPAERKKHPVRVRVGEQEQSFLLTGANQTFELDFMQTRGAHTVEFLLSSGSADVSAVESRDLGIGLVRLSLRAL